MSRPNSHPNLNIARHDEKAVGARAATIFATAHDPRKGTNMRHRVYWAAVLILTAAAPALAGERPWEMVSNKQGITVERRHVDGSNLMEFRGRGIVDAPVSAILATFKDVDRATEWMDSCNGSALVEDAGDWQKVVYNRTHAPWPVSDRDAVLRNLLTFDAQAGQVRLEFASVDHSRRPPVRGVVRMPFLRGHWYLWPEADGRTRVEYQVHADPGGLLPTWMVNYASKEIPRKTITGLQAQLKRRSYPDVERWIRAQPEYRFIEEKTASAMRR
jgi:hypothetical protein